MGVAVSPGGWGALFPTRLAWALLVSAVLHGVLLSLGFHGVKPPPVPRAQPTLDIVLVNARSVEAPLAPDALGQANLAGGGNTDADRRLKSRLPARADTRVSESRQAMAQRVKALEEQARALMTQLKTDPSVSVARPLTAAELNRQAQALAQQESREMAELQARIARDWSEYQKRPRRAFVGANVKEYAFARYVEDWVTKVERIGNLNYPEAARQQGLYGSLKLTVSIHTDGSLEKIEVDRGSGSKILDAAAHKIVRLGAPYAHFPPEMREKVDILSITRTWTFTRSDQLSGDE